jgi:hypothetical protein
MDDSANNDNADQRNPNPDQTMATGASGPPTPEHLGDGHDEGVMFQSELDIKE